MYILECADGTYYTGSTVNLEKRLWEHENFIGANYTKKRHPVKLVYCEEHARIDEAFYREKQVQGWSRAKKKALIEHNWEKIKELAECMNRSHWKNAGFDSAQPANKADHPVDNCETEAKRPLSLAENTGFDFAQPADEGRLVDSYGPKTNGR
jgi:putative endonuclease